ncbi:helix-turn-helix domain-containing protein [Haloarchaeobius sp. HRN-SO-5]|uniref:helix-turn-helix domain-containing protein n=1 Tax=Haloarchaeobius sp. HRN-SO-5 TaxID=3446118 RepID=UPI003EB6C74F
MNTDEAFDPPLERALGYPARVAILGVLTEARDQELGASEIAARADLAASTFHEHRDPLRSLGFLERTSGDGYPTYSLAETPQVEALDELDEALAAFYDESGQEDESAVREFVK